MRGGTFLKGGVAFGAAVSTAVLAAVLATTAAYAGTGINAVLNLGTSNTVNATTTLGGSSGKTLQLNNSGAGPAIGLHTASGQPPLSTNSRVKVHNLNSGLLDGHGASDFDLRSDQARMDAPDIGFGSSQTWNVGPYISLVASCSDPSGNSTSTVQILNNSPSSGGWTLEDIINKSLNPGTALTHGGINLGSGLEATLTQAVNNSSGNLVGSSDFVTVIWTDGSGESITATYNSIADEHFCYVEGTAMRTT